MLGRSGFNVVVNFLREFAIIAGEILYIERIEWRR